jgi:hypothetical protein
MERHQRTIFGFLGCHHRLRQDLLCLYDLNWELGRYLVELSTMDMLRG